MAGFQSDEDSNVLYVDNGFSDGHKLNPTAGTTDIDKSEGILSSDEHLSKYLFFFPFNEEFTIIFNALTGGLYIFDADRKLQLDHLEAYGSEGSKDVDLEFLSFCKKEKIYLQTPNVEDALVQQRWLTAQEPGKPLNVTVMLTEACNLSCKYCYQEKSVRMLSKVNQRRLVHFLLRKASEHSSIHIHWFGGEPMLEYQVLLNLAHEISKKLSLCGVAFDHSITTNGTLISSYVAQRLKQVGITHVQVTLDGDRVSHDSLRIKPGGEGSFNAVLDGILACSQAGIPVYIRVNLNRLTAPRVPNLFSILSENGLGREICTIYFPETIQHDRKSDTERTFYYPSVKAYAKDLLKCMEQLVQQGYPLPPLMPRSYHCPFDLNNSVLFGVDAYLYFCTTGVDWKIAKIDRDGVEIPLVKRNPRTILESSRCRNCEVLPLCMGGCAYLEKVGRPRCTPERFILEPLVRLHVSQQLETEGR